VHSLDTRSVSRIDYLLLCPCDDDAKRVVRAPTHRNICASRPECLGTRRREKCFREDREPLSGEVIQYSHRRAQPAVTSVTAPSRTMFAIFHENACS
jgi:hypothetical protein